MPSRPPIPPALQLHRSGLSPGSNSVLKWQYGGYSSVDPVVTPQDAYTSGFSRCFGQHRVSEWRQVTMVYTDPPGTPGTDPENSLVNDLDLTVQKVRGIYCRR
jgi:hypothetical protein